MWWKKLKSLGLLAQNEEKDALRSVSDYGKL